MSDSHFDHEFEVVTDGPPPMPWDDYKRIASDALRTLLDDGDAGELEAQRLLEKFPCLVPGPDAFEGGNPGPVRSTLYTQPEIPGLPRRIPDFMWLPTNSEVQWAVLVEIEDPRKRWFNKDGTPTAKLTQAQNQIAEWKSLLQEPVNQMQFVKMYGIAGRPLAFKYCLVYGRRSEVGHTLGLEGKRRHLRQDNTLVMTYDRLTPDEKARDCITGKLRNGITIATTIPPTISISPYLIQHQGRVQGRPEAVEGSPHFSEDRRKFLIERFRYWDEIQDKGGLNGILPLSGE